MNPTTSALHAVLVETRGWFENQAKAVSKGCGSSYELHDLRAQRDALDVALAASTQPAAPAQAVEYPPLPKTDRIGRVFDGKFIVGNCHLYEIHQMRAYVDADRAARGAAQAATCHPAVKSDMLVNGGALKLALNVLRRAGKTEVADELECTAQAALVDAEVQQDAERWRIARSLEHCNAIWCAIGNGEAAGNLDATVDKIIAARAAQGGANG